MISFNALLNEKIIKPIKAAMPKIIKPTILFFIIIHVYMF
jgi:hypothetical protein